MPLRDGNIGLTTLELHLKKTEFYRVEELNGFDTVKAACLSEKANHGFDPTKIELLRSKKMAEGGPGSYWRIISFTAENKVHQTTRRNLLSSAAANTFDAELFVGSESPGQSQPALISKDLEPRDGISPIPKEAEIAVRLQTAFNIGGSQKTLNDRISGGIDVGDWDGDFLALSDNVLLRSSEFVREGSLLRPVSERINMWSIHSSVDTVKDGRLIVFLNSPQIETSRQLDLRTDTKLFEEFIELAQRTLGDRKETEVQFDDMANQMSMIGLSPDDEATLNEGINRLRHRLDVSERMREVLLNLPEIRSSIDAIVAAEAESHRADTQRKIDEEFQTSREQLAQIQTELERRQAELHDLNIQTDALSAASTRAKQLLDSIEVRFEQRFRGLQSEIENRFDDVTTRWKQERNDEMEKRDSNDKRLLEGVKRPSFASPTHALEKSERLFIVGELAAEIAGGAAAVGYAIGAAFEGIVPVFTGNGAGRLASEFAYALNPGLATVLSVDPTIISLDDLLNSTSKGPDNTILQIIDIARSQPDVCFPIAICGIENSPVRFWYDALMLARWDGRIPQNVIVFSSCNADDSMEPLPAVFRATSVPFLVDAWKKHPMQRGENTFWKHNAVERGHTKIVSAVKLLTITEERTKAIVSAIMDSALFITEVDPAAVAMQADAHARWMTGSEVASDRFPPAAGKKEADV